MYLAQDRDQWRAIVNTVRVGFLDQLSDCQLLKKDCFQWS
jgi:hypothetical protein